MLIWLLLTSFVAVALVALCDITQRRHSILRNFPVIGHLRYLLEAVGPELRQYIVASNLEERPFNRDQRSWIYASSKQQNNRHGFGTETDSEIHSHHIVARHAAFPLNVPLPGDAAFDPLHEIPCGKVLGEARKRRQAFRMHSAVNISAMSYGSLSGPAIEALNRGALLAGCLHNTGEGGISQYHQLGGELIWQIGTSYFGCRDEKGKFCKSRFLETAESARVRAIEIKLSQGAKPGMGGLLPAAKITPEIAAIRGIEVGKDCASPNGHSAFRDTSEMLDFVEELAESSGLPVGIKSAVGMLDFWLELAFLMQETNRGVDFITIDGGEGGTGAAPRVFADHVALPFKVGFSEVYKIFAEHNLHNDVVFIGSAKLGLPETALFAFGLGCDAVNVGREAMMAIGCIQAQRCHTGHCPAGIATQNRWLMRGLDPTLKSARAANYIVALRKELLQLTHTCGLAHPGQLTIDQFDILDGKLGTKSAREQFGYRTGWGAAPDQSASPARFEGVGTSRRLVG